MEIRNTTPIDLARLLAFVEAEMERYGYQHDNLTIRFAHRYHGGSYCRYPMKEARKSGRRQVDKRGHFRITIGNWGDVYPYNYEVYVGARQNNKVPASFRSVRDLLLWNVDSLVMPTEEVWVGWIVFHELWHFICKSGQDRGNTQSAANRFAFKETRRFLSEYN